MSSWKADSPSMGHILTYKYLLIKKTLKIYKIWLVIVGEFTETYKDRCCKNVEEQTRANAVVAKP